MKEFQVGKRYHNDSRTTEIYVVSSRYNGRTQVISVRHGRYHEGSPTPVEKYLFQTETVLNINEWFLISEEEECPHCKKKVMQDMLGLCPECGWLLKEETK